jgi:two-component system, response regulator / RNA-binding antiterminator
VVIKLGRNEALTDALRAAAPDVIIVDMSRPDRDALDSVRAVAIEHPHPIVQFVDEDDPAFMEAAVAPWPSPSTLACAAARRRVTRRWA